MCVGNWSRDVHAMADSDVVQQLEERAKEAESAIELLKNQLQGLKEKAGS